MKRYRIWRESELGESEFVAEYDSFFEAMEHLRNLEFWGKGWHYDIKEVKYYKVWYVNQYSERFLRFERISEYKLKEFLRNQAEYFSDKWWINHLNSEVKDCNIPYNGMGYYVEFEEVK